jgi:hypothetical protein
MRVKVVIKRTRKRNVKKSREKVVGKRELKAFSLSLMGDLQGLKGGLVLW